MTHSTHYYHHDPARGFGLDVEVRFAWVTGDGDARGFGLDVEVRFAWVTGDGDAPGFVGRQDFAVTAVRVSSPRDPYATLSTTNGTLAPATATALSRLFASLVEADERLRERIDAECEAAAKGESELTAALDPPATLTLHDAAQAENGSAA